MTEAEWLRSRTPNELLWYLEGGSHRVLQFKAGRRKMRLLACAWCRPLLQYLPGEWGHAVVEMVERFADGLIGKRDLAAVHEVARECGARVVSDFAQACAAGAPGALEASRLPLLAAQALQALPLNSSPLLLGNLGVPLNR